MLVTKLTFFENLANDLQPFLVEFQCDKPLIPFLYDKLLLICKHISSKFVEEDALASADICKLDLNKSENVLTAKQINLGHATKCVFSIKGLNIFGNSTI